MPRIHTPTIVINEQVRAQLQDLNINSTTANRMQNRWMALDAQGFPFIDSYRIITAIGRGSLLKKLREQLDPLPIPSRELAIQPHQFTLMIFNEQNPSQISFLHSVESRYIDGLALRVGPSNTVGYRRYVPFMFEHPWEIPVVSREVSSNLNGGWHALRVQQRTYQKYINTCMLATNNIIEEMIRLGTIRIGLIRDLILNREVTEAYPTDYLNDR
jgi:hypothetical protein